MKDNISMMRVTKLIEKIDKIIDYKNMVAELTFEIKDSIHKSLEYEEMYLMKNRDKYMNEILAENVHRKTLGVVLEILENLRNKYQV